MSAPHIFEVSSALKTSVFLSFLHLALTFKCPDYRKPELTSASDLNWENDFNTTFPNYFLFSAASAAYQIEGGWNLNGKSESIWDRVVHSDPSFIADKSNGDVACDSYHKYKQDVQLLRKVGFNVYRFSLSWPRILPTGEENDINQDGINYYNGLIDELVENNIQPMVTLYHWDLPQRLQDFGGWLNPIMADYFEKYARVVFNSFGKKVNLWITINEPTEIVAGYSSKNYAPALDLKSGIVEYLAAHTLIRAHAKAYRLYEKEFKSAQNGKISFAMAGSYCIPKTSSQEDQLAAERSNQFSFGWFGHPIYSSTGDYPPIMRSIVDRNSAMEGRRESRLPVFSKQEVQFIRGTFDFLGMNHYTSRLCSDRAPSGEPSRDNDVSVNAEVDPSWPGSASSWLKVVPCGFRENLKWIKNTYDNPPVFVTENGFSDSFGLQDTDRINYYKGYLLEMLKAMRLDGCQVIGHTAWSIMDNFEWRRGFTERFGLFRVNFSDPDRARTAKDSAMFFQKLISTRTL